MTTISTSAAAARESARSTDGKFGHQAHVEADISLTGRQEPYFGSIAVTAAITEMDGFAQATANRDGTITATTVHGDTLGPMQDERGTWWCQPVVDDTGIDWGNRYGRDRYCGSTPQQALTRTAHNVHLQSLVTERLEIDQ